MKKWVLIFLLSVSMLEADAEAPFNFGLASPKNNASFTEQLAYLKELRERIDQKVTQFESQENPGDDAGFADLLEFQYLVSPMIDEENTQSSTPFCDLFLLTLSYRLGLEREEFLTKNLSEISLSAVEGRKLFKQICKK